jgi:hypothetical protein
MVSGRGAADPTPRASETAFGRGAWLTLVAAAAALFTPLIIVLVGAELPTDGWMHTSDPSDHYRLVFSVTGEPSALREGDVIVAINGESLYYGYRSALPDQLAVGQVLRYSVMREDKTLELDVPVVAHSPRTLLNTLMRSAQYDVFSLVYPLLTLLIVGFAFVRRPGNPAARLLVLIFAYFAGGNWFGFANWDPYVYAYPTPLAVAGIIYWFGWAWLFFPALTHLVLVFPVRLPPVRRFPRLVPALVYGVPALLTLGAVLLALAGRPEARPFDNAAIVGGVGMFVVTLIASFVYGFRTVRDPVGRAQVRWVALGLGVGWGVGIVVNFVGTFVPALEPLTETLFALLVLLLPLSLVIAITRYRLFDIDVIINRVLVYALLTAALAAVYLAAVVLAQGIVRSLTGQESDLAIVVATLAVAALFQPLRGHIQAFIDRRFFRRKYDAAQVLAAHAAAVRDEVDIARLTQVLARAADETLRPAHVSVWLQTPEGRP